MTQIESGVHLVTEYSMNSNGSGAWEQSPFLVALSPRVIKANIDAVAA
jgi:hypothetical protein